MSAVFGELVGGRNCSCAGRLVGRVRAPCLVSREDAGELQLVEEEGDPDQEEGPCRSHCCLWEHVCRRLRQGTFRGRLHIRQQ